MRRLALCLLAFGAATSPSAAVEPPEIPVGLDAYLQWEKWPYHRIGARAYMRSTYDRSGGNHRADAANFLHQLSDEHNVTLDVEGQGVLYFARYNHWHGSPWRYVVDGKEFVVTETSTADPDNPVPDSRFEPHHLFPNPLTFTWSTTKGADLMWVPIPFENSFQMAYTRTFYGTGYYIYHLYSPSAKLSRPIKAWDAETPPSQEALDFISRAGTDISPPGLPEQEGTISELRPGESTTVLEIDEAPATLRKIAFSVPIEEALAFGRAKLRITWDKRAVPSVDAPIALFFGAGTLYNGDDREYLVKALPAYIRYGNARVELACFFPMPFFESAKIELIAPENSVPIDDIQWTIKQEALQASRSELGWFHATYRDHGLPEKGKDLVLLDTRKTEGGGDWSGNFVGTSFIFSENAVLSTLEGDPRFFFDDSQTPQAQGTGTEEWGGGGDYWGGRNMTLPFAGHPNGVRRASDAKHPEELIQSAYRFLLADLMPFGKNARIHLEHGANNQSTERYKTVAYWYGANYPTLVKTDSLQIGDPASEAAHRYQSPDASTPYQITSRYEWGPDHATETGNWVVPDPPDSVEFEFEAEAGKTYHLWFRGRSEEPTIQAGSFWVQFDDAIGSLRPGYLVPFTREFNYGVGNWTSTELSWSSRMPDDETPLSITFKEGGTHRLRVYPRVEGAQLEQILLSPYREVAPETDQISEPKARGEILLSAKDATSRTGELIASPDPKSIIGSVLRMADGVTAQEFFPASTDTGRTTTGTSEFTLAINPNNHGVMLRRKLDYAFLDQRAEVFIADGSLNQPSEADWQSAGTWYLAGSNKYVHSYPQTETGKTRHQIKESNRRFRDDEFLVSKDLTEGLSSLRIRIKFTPVGRPLYPGHPLAPQAWSEIRYDAYSYVLPEGQ